MRYCSDFEMFLGRPCHARLAGLEKGSPRASLPVGKRSQELRNGSALFDVRTAGAKVRRKGTRAVHTFHNARPRIVPLSGGTAR